VLALHSAAVTRNHGAFVSRTPCFGHGGGRGVVVAESVRERGSAVGADPEPVEFPAAVLCALDEEPGDDVARDVPGRW